LGVPQRVLSKRIRVFSTIVVALTYCVSHSGRLFKLIWFPCLLYSACLVLLEWLIYGWPPRMPQWLITDQLYPPTWLTPAVAAPFIAMVWAFVLSDICDGNSDRGILTVADVRYGWLRFELSPAVLAGAGIFIATDLIDTLLRFARLKLLISLYDFLEGPASFLDAWAYPTIALGMLATAALQAWTYPIAAQVLLIAGFDRSRIQWILRRNWLRLTAIFFLLGIAVDQFGRFIRPALNWVTEPFGNPLVWTMRQALMQYAIQFPFDMFWIAAWVVTMAFVMKGLRSPVPPSESPAG
jgi:hypothetical protein